MGCDVGRYLGTWLTVSLFVPKMETLGITTCEDFLRLTLGKDSLARGMSSVAPAGACSSGLTVAAIVVRSAERESAVGR